MPRIVLMVGTRKGCFLLESDAERRDWEVRGPFCEGWPIYHAVHDAESGAHLRRRGERVARRRRLAQQRPRRELGALERGARLRRRRPEAVEDLGPDRRARARARGRRGGGHLREPRRRRDAGRCSARSTASRAATTGTSRPTSRRATSACRAILPHPDDPARFWAVVQGFGIFETTDDGASWTPRNEGCAPTGRASTPRSASACTSS